MTMLIIDIHPQVDENTHRADAGGAGSVGDGARSEFMNHEIHQPVNVTVSSRDISPLAMSPVHSFREQRADVMAILLADANTGTAAGNLLYSIVLEYYKNKIQ